MLEDALLLDAVPLLLDAVLLPDALPPVPTELLANWLDADDAVLLLADPAPPMPPPPNWNEG